MRALDWNLHPVTSKYMAEFMLETFQLTRSAHLSEHEVARVLVLKDYLKELAMVRSFLALLCFPYPSYRF